ncbi:hypothetical protein FA15DRAFT_673320 [Coprinopsis marcescibilis]|uniref:Uncharacterized protein n=1 Tax=Coprinopsis marcescibilis TaxID=230819 RepID=A0A5C3KJY4_COPMA|nr:hypothetical protein FA15DRAFT_673320 [Coprinopsis marcescibilis]
MDDACSSCCTAFCGIFALCGMGSLAACCDTKTYGANGCCNSNTTSGCCGSCCNDSFNDDQFERQIQKDLEKTRDPNAPATTEATTQQPISTAAMQAH